MAAFIVAPLQGLAPFTSFTQGFTLGWPITGRWPSAPNTARRSAATVLLEMLGQYRLRDVLAAVTKTNRHAAVDFGEPAAREAW